MLLGLFQETKTTILTVMKKLKNFIYSAWRCKVLTAYRIKHLNMSAFRMIKNLSWNLRTYLFQRKGLDTSKMVFIVRAQNGKQFSRFCLDHSRARNGRVIRKQLKQTCRTKQRNEKWLKHKVSGYKSQSKRRSIAGCRLLLRTLRRKRKLGLSLLCQAYNHDINAYVCKVKS